MDGHTTQRESWTLSPPQSLLVAELRRERAESEHLPIPAMRKAIRESAHVSLARVAAILGVHRASVSRWESGKRTPRGEQRRRYKRLLDELKELSRDEL